MHVILLEVRVFVIEVDMPMDYLALEGIREVRVVLDEDMTESRREQGLGREVTHEGHSYDHVVVRPNDVGTFDGRWSLKGQGSRGRHGHDCRTD